MPFLRYVRDHRGNENTYLVHTFRRFGKTHPEVLYWFRTPPHLQYGREALDDGTMKAIQENFPYVKFDWPKILERKQPQSNAKPDDDSRPPRRQKQRTDPKRSRRKRTAEKVKVSADRDNELLENAQLNDQEPVGEIKTSETENREEVSTETLPQTVSSGSDQKPASSKRTTQKRRGRNRWNGLNRRSNRQDGVAASERIERETIQEDTKNSKMNTKLGSNDAEVNGNTVNTSSSSSEISEDTRAKLPGDKTEPSS